MISQSQYVDITSGVGGQAQASAREHILRVFTSASKMPSGTVLEFTSANAVGEYFGFNSREYALAQTYFSFVSAQQQSPSKLSFCADTSAGKAPFLRATAAPGQLSAFQAVTDGSFTLSLGGLSGTVSGLDFSSAAAYADIASAVQTALRAAQSSSPMWQNRRHCAAHRRRVRHGYQRTAGAQRSVQPRSVAGRCVHVLRANAL